ncbi:MAG TPA: M13 family metallopeptidase, partial [Saprospiraceae bacterium]|nr:M13 family metallopeptidase [Saprospiraceae bacterium]
ALQISRNNFVQNIINSNVFEYNEMVEKLKKPVDKTEWLMSPAMVNAYYNPQTNEIAFPAGILQPPFFNLAADDAINYGAIGAVIGHEMTHGFDDQGRLYDNEGNLGDWWTAEDAKAYESRAQKVVDQYNAYTVYDTVHVKGELTLGENIADLGGLAIAFDAFKKTAEFKEGKSIDGYTPEQRFFLGFGQIWRMKNTQKMMLNRINTDPHSPEEFRIKGSVSNFTPWYEAWKITPQDKLYKPENERIKVW